MAELGKLVKRVIRFLRSKPLRWYAVLLLVAGAGPFAIDVAIMIDLITVMGADVFFVSLLMYYREALFGSARAYLARIRAVVERNGLLWPNRSWLESPAECGRRITYNLDIMEVPLRIAVCTLFGLAIAVKVAQLT